MPAAEIAQSVFKIAKMIYDRVQLVKANQAQFKRLVARIQVVQAAINKLDQIPESEDFIKGLDMLQDCLKETLTFINEFSGQSKWYQKAIYAGKNEKKFLELNQQLQECLPLLSLGMLGHQLSKQEEDAADQKADAKALLAGQAQILSLNERMLKELQDFKGAAAERDRILAKQMASLRLQLMYIQKPEEAKSLIAARDRIAYCELLFGELLAKGNVSQVYQGSWQGQPVAIKLFTSALSGEASLEFAREVKITSRLRHPNIVRFYGAALEGSNACVVMELLAYDLPGYLAARSIKPLQQKQIALDIAQALAYLHSQSMIHRDLRGANILLTAEGRAKLADFGLAKTQAHTIQSVGGKVTQMVAWCAPELLSAEGEVTEKVDIYSFGTVLWEIFTGKQPFANLSLSKITEKILAGEREQLPEDLPNGLGEMITACWSADPSKRPELSAIVNWLERYDPVQSCYQQAKQMEEKKEYQQARKYYQLAADEGLHNALVKLGVFALSGRHGEPADKNKAYQLFLAAAEKGHPHAMRNLAIMLDKGDDIPVNQQQALIWYEKAGDAASLSRAKRLKEKFTAADKAALAQHNVSLGMG